MTCIVGLAQDGKVYIGADSAGVAGYSITARADGKVFRRGPYVLGFAGSFRMGQLLRYSVELPIPPAGLSDDDLDAFMVVNFVEAVRAAMTEGGYTRIKDGREEGGCFLVGIHGRLFAIDSDFQIGRAHDTYMAIGCGDDLALGSLHGSDWMNPPVRVRRALEAAAHHSAGVCKPFKVVSA
jgi:hypothetical protein